MTIDVSATHPTSLGKYRITEVLGEGAMGVVYKGIDPRIGRTVALKTIRSPLLAAASDDGATNRERFLREAVAAGRLSHPGIVQLYEFDEQDGLAYIAMEFVEGRTLAQRLAAKERCDEATIDELMVQLLAALQHAHEQGVWHRDIKPANLIVNGNGRLKIADFGIARVDGGGVTQAGKVIGTPVYIAPERYTGGTVDHRVDLYAAGVVLYQLLTGEPPFKGSTRELVFQAVNQLPTPPSQVPGAARSRHYDTIVACALAKDPARRYATARLFADALLAPSSQDTTTLLDVAAAAASPELPAPADDRLPADATSFIGRQALVGQALQLLAEARLLTLAGPGGTGKTRLALQVARLAQLRCSDGARWVDLAPVPPGQPVATRIAEALELPEPPSDRDATPALVRALASRELLVVLDNCEHVLAGAADFAAALLREAPRARVLATSRQAIGVADETVLPVPAMAVAADDADRAQRIACEAVQLFAARAQALRPGFRLDGEHLDAVLQICRRLDGIPLAIELAAARVKVLAPAQIAARLADAFRLLVAHPEGQLPRQQTLRALFDWSWDLLPERERTTFARLAVFRGDFDLEAAEAVLPDDTLPAEAVLDAMDELVDRSLVVASEQGSVMRYRLLQTVALYAGERLGNGEHRRALQQRHGGHYLQRAQGAAAQLGGNAQAEAFAVYTGVGPNLLAALDAATEAGDFGLAVPLAAAMAAYWLARGIARDGMPRIERLLAAGPPDSPLLAQVLQRGGRIALVLLHRRALAREWYGRGLAIARALGDAALESSFLRGLGGVAFHARDFAAAVPWFEQALLAARTAGDPLLEAMAEDNLGAVALSEGRYDAACEQMERALALYRTAGSVVEQAKCLHNLSVAEYHRGRAARAEELLHECLAIQQAVGDLRSETMARAQIGINRARRGEHAAAAEAFRDAVACARRTDDQRLLASTLEHLAGAQTHGGDPDAAMASARESLRLRRASENAEDLAEPLHTFAELLAERNPRLAARLLGHAAALLQRHGVVPSHNERGDIDTIERAVRAQLGDAAYEEAAAEGAQHHLEMLFTLAGGTRQPG